MTQHGFPVHQEQDDLPSAHLLRITAGSLVVFVVGVFFAGLILTAGTGSIHPSEAGPGGTQPALRSISRIEQTPIRASRDGIDLREAQARELHRWGWANRDAGLVTIPIESAIDLAVGQAAR